MRNSMKKLLYITLIFFLLLSSPVWATDKFVSTGGSADWGDCTVVGTPCSLATANTNADDDDVVVMLDGDYTTAINPTNSGSSGHPITFQSQYEYDASGSQYGAKVEASNPAIDLTSSQDYITIDGVGSDNAKARIIDATNATYIILTNSHLSMNANNQNIWFHSQLGDGCDYWEIDNNVFDAIAIAGTETTGSLLGLNDDADYNYIHDNTFKDGSDHDFITIRGSYNIIKGNTFYNTGLYTVCDHSWPCNGAPDEIIVVQHGANYNVIEDNIMYESGVNIGDGHLVAFHYENSSYNITRGNIVRQMDGWGIDIFINTNTAESSSYNTTYHNTFYKVSYDYAWRPAYLGALLFLSEISSGSNVVTYNAYANNIISNTGMHGFTVNETVSGRLSNNINFGNWIYNIGTEDVLFVDVDDGSATNTLSYMETNFASLYYENYSPNPSPLDATDPKLTDPASGDMTLHGGSGCIDAAEPLTYTNGIAGGGSSDQLIVDNSYFFQANSGITGWSADTIYVDAATPFSVVITSINHGTSTLTLASAQDWEDGVAVYWCPNATCFAGTAPDIGAEEYSTSGNAITITYCVDGAITITPDAGGAITITY